MEIKQYDHSYRNQVVALLALLWEADLEEAERHFRVKHEENPWTQGPLIFMAVEKDIVIGIRPVVYLPVEWNGNLLDTYQMADAFVAPAHRSMGCLQILTKRVEEYIHSLDKPALILALSSNPISAKSHLKNGFELLRKGSIIYRNLFGYLMYKHLINNELTAKIAIIGNSKYIISIEPNCPFEKTSSAHAWPINWALVNWKQTYMPGSTIFCSKECQSGELEEFIILRKYPNAHYRVIFMSHPKNPDLLRWFLNQPGVGLVSQQDFSQIKSQKWKWRAKRTAFIQLYKSVNMTSMNMEKFDPQEIFSDHFY